MRPLAVALLLLAAPAGASERRLLQRLSGAPVTGNLIDLSVLELGDGNHVPSGHDPDLVLLCDGREQGRPTAAARFGETTPIDLIVVLDIPAGDDALAPLAAWKPRVIRTSGDGPYLYEGVGVALEQLASLPRQRRKLMVIVSDQHFADARPLAQRAKEAAFRHTVVDTVGSDPALAKMAQLTNGVARSSPLADALVDVADEIRRQWVLRYQVDPDCVHALMQGDGWGLSSTAITIRPPMGDPPPQRPQWRPSARLIFGAVALLVAALLMLIRRRVRA